MMRKALLALGMVGVMTASASAAVTLTTTHHTNGNGLDGLISTTDLIAGMNGTELPGDQGWHPANPASGNSLHPFGLPAFTDGTGSPGGVYGLLNDFPTPLGTPVKRVQYDLGAPSFISEIGILSGNFGTDGRIFSTTVVSYSTNNGGSFTQLGYFQSDPSGTLNNPLPNFWQATRVRIFDNAAGFMLTGVTNLIFEMFAVDNTGGQMRDPFDGVNPYTGLDDGLTAAFVSPLVFEVDVLPEPATLGLLAMGALAMIRRRR